ncbi:MAG: hypothetical protein V7746_25825 [Halioglobus sp.]
MSERKNRREIDKAIRHLIDYEGPNNEWAGRLDQLEDEFLAPVADKLDLGLDEVSDFFFDGYFEHMAFGFVFEEYATAVWDNEKTSLVDTYLKHRGWREGSAGRRYLQALGDSELKFWEITAVKSGAYVDIRTYGTKEKSIRVNEKLATESLVQWDGLAARVLPTGSGNSFSGALLPFTPELAERVQAVLAGVPDNTRQMMQELVDSGQIDALPDDMEALALETLDDELPRITFLFWAVDTYVRANGPPPELRNMDDEPIELTQLRFPLQGEHSMVVKALDSSPVLERDTDDGLWAWFPKPYEDISPEERVSILGHIELKDTSLQLDTNSVARVERGGKMLASLLGSLVGSPLTVHENPQLFSEDEPIEFGTELPPELQEAMDVHLTAHYRQCLDDAIPMLNGKTPRECAADPALRNDVIGWLKYMENSDKRSPQPSYDFTWMWKELNLKRE